MRSLAHTSTGRHQTKTHRHSHTHTHPSWRTTGGRGGINRVGMTWLANRCKVFFCRGCTTGGEGRHIHPCLKIKNMWIKALVNSPSLFTRRDRKRDQCNYHVAHVLHVLVCTMQVLIFNVFNTSGPECWSRSPFILTSRASKRNQGIKISRIVNANSSCHVPRVPPQINVP